MNELIRHLIQRIDCTFITPASVVYQLRQQRDEEPQAAMTNPPFEAVANRHGLKGGNE